MLFILAICIMVQVQKISSTKLAASSIGIVYLIIHDNIAHQQTGPLPKRTRGSRESQIYAYTKFHESKLN